MSSTGEKLRLFVAVRVPADVRAALGHAQTELRAQIPPRAVSWTRPDNLHLTLRFLGSVEADRFAALNEPLGCAVAGFGKMTLKCERAGCFPDGGFPRVLWASVTAEGGRLQALHRIIETVVGPFAQQPAVPEFVGHITLARFKHLRRREADVVARFVQERAARAFGNWLCAEIELIRSELSPEGSRYTTLATYPLDDESSDAM